MFERPSCTDCKKEAPETNTPHTLLSASFAWRLSKVESADGAAGVEWRCPTCWRARKAAIAKANDT